MLIFPDLSRQTRLFIDTETTGLSDRDRPVGLSVAWYDGEGRLDLENCTAYLRWGHERGGNNCSLDEVREWSRRELVGKDAVFHNAAFDMRMMAYEGIAGLDANPWAFASVEDTGFMSALNDENEPSHRLDDLAIKYGASRAGKENELLAALQAEFGGSLAWHGKMGQAQNIHRASGDLIDRYARTDPYRTAEVWHSDLMGKMLGQGLEGVYRLECDLIPILLRMHLTGVRIDTEKAELVKSYLSRRFGEAQLKWDARTTKILGRPANINSPNDLEAVFKHAGIWRKFPPTTGAQKKIDRGEIKFDEARRSFGAEYLEAMKDEHWAPALILDIRKHRKYSDTFIDAYLLKRVDADGVLHGQFNQVRNDAYGTVSGRFSSSDPNLQNIPSPGRDPDGAKRIRSLFVPFEGMNWFKIDWSQIEFRFLAHYCDVLADVKDGLVDEEKLERYRSLARAYEEHPDIDFHQKVADLVEQDRYEAKHQNFGMVYGMGIAKLARKLGKTLEEARPVFDQYHERMPGIGALYQDAMGRASRRGWIKTWYGRVRHFRKNTHGGRSRFQRTYSALNALLQGSAADLMKVAMREACGPGGPAHENPDLMVQLTVHDELDGSYTPNTRGIESLEALQEVMRKRDWEGAKRIRVPVMADAEVGHNWGDVSEKHPFNMPPKMPTGTASRADDRKREPKRQKIRETRSR